MKQQFLIIICLPLVVVSLVVSLALALSETEPNDTPAEANPLAYTVSMDGSINPIGDVDYYALNGVSTSWGFIALLETDGSTTSQQATLNALGSDGVTVLQSDTGSWEHGSGIALQGFADGGDTHYLRVNENGDDATVFTYTLRYYETVVASQPEVEPNETRGSGTSSSFTHDGTLSSTSDIDCFAFHGRDEDTILLALDGDPENDGSPVDVVLELVDPTNTTLATADASGAGGKEFIEYIGLPGEGVYAYCLRVGSGTGGSTATYKVGLIVNGALYFPSYEQGPTWLNPRPGGIASISDTLTFQLAITNTSIVTIPGDIDLSATYNDTCLDFVGANPAPTSISSGFIDWNGQKPEGLTPGEVYSVTVDFQALALCNDIIYQSTVITYFFTGTSGIASYLIGTPVYLPLISRP